MSYYQFFAKIYQLEAKKMCLDCQPFIEKGSKILDFGCGSGIVAEALQNFFQADVFGVDIKDERVTNIPFKIIDGQSLPFPENSFNICFVSYVLHHAENVVRILEEIKRVTKEKIIIFEDLPESFLSKIFCQIHKITFNQFFLKQNPGSNFKKSEEWKKLFNALGLKIIFKKNIFPVFRPGFWIYPVKRILFVLEKV